LFDYFFKDFMPRGGRRPGAGRKGKPKLPAAAQASAVELFLHNRDFEKLIGDAFRLARSPNVEVKDRLDVIKLLLAYRDGKPRQRHEVTGPDGESLFDPLDELLAKLDRLATAG